VLCVGVMSARRWREALCFSVTLVPTCNSNWCLGDEGVSTREKRK